MTIPEQPEPNPSERAAQPSEAPPFPASSEVSLSDAASGAESSVSESSGPESFASNVRRLVAEGKLTEAEAAELLEPVYGSAQASVQPVTLNKDGQADGSEDLHLEVAGYGLQVIRDPALAEPRLSANRDGVLKLRSGQGGWSIEVAQFHRLGGVKAVLSLPFMPRSVRAEISGGTLTLPDISGSAQIEVSGGNATLGGAAELKAEVSGGNLTAGVVSGALHLEVNGGNTSVAGSSALRAEVNGGQLSWTGRLDTGRHSLEVNGGQATLRLSEGSSVQVQAESTLGGVSASFPLAKSGGMMHATYSGTLGGGAATLKCEVNAGQIRLVAEGADGSRS